MTPAELELRGQLLYGRQWQKDLARNLGVCRGAVTNWKCGRRKMKTKYERKIEDLLSRRVVMIQSLISFEAKKETRTLENVRTLAA